MITGVGGAAIAFVSQAERAGATQAAGFGLNAVASSIGLTFGTAVRLKYLTDEADLRLAVQAQCGELTPEIGLKWAVIEPRRGALDFSEMDDLAAFALKHKLKLRGHTLLWHQSVPAWAAATLQHDKDWDLLTRYFASVMPRYGASIDAWDVINEPIATGHRMDGLRQSVFLDAFGPEYISHALSTARVFAPSGKLFINEYGLEYDTPEEKARRYLLLKLLERLKKANVPLDGVGLQSHLDLRKGRVSVSEIRAFLNNIEDLGLLVRVSELDVKESDYAASVEARDHMVADEVKRYLDVVLGARRFTGVTTWGLSDRHSWLEVTPEDLARFPEAWKSGGGPGLNRGLPYDSDMRPKPVYAAIAGALRRS